MSQRGAADTWRNGLHRGLSHWAVDEQHPHAAPPVEALERGGHPRRALLTLPKCCEPCHGGSHRGAKG